MNQQYTHNCVTHSCRLRGNCLRYKIDLPKTIPTVHKPDTPMNPCVYYWDEFTGEKYD